MPAPASVIVSKPPSGQVKDFDVVLRDGRPLLVCTPDVSHRACTWDPVDEVWTEYALDSPWLSDYDGDHTDLGALGAVLVDGRIVIGGGGAHQGFAQWDLETGQVRLFAEDRGVTSVTTADFAGHPLFVVGGSGGTEVQLWDPSVAERGEHGEGEHDRAWEEEISPRDFVIEIEELRSDSPVSSGVAAGMLGDRPVAVAVGEHKVVLVWDIDKQRPLVTFDNRDQGVRHFALATVGGAARVVAAGGRGIVLGDPEARAWTKPLSAPCDAISCLDVAVVKGCPVAVTGAADGMVCAWDLAEGRLIGEPFQEHRQQVLAVRLTEVDGRPVIVSAGGDGFVRVWELVP